MKTILSIGSSHFLIPSSVNVNAILGALSKASMLDRVWSHARNEEVFQPSKYERDITIRLVREDQIITPKKPKLKAIAETASPDAHNTFGS